MHVTSDSVIFGHHARSESSERVIDGQWPPGIHSEGIDTCGIAEGEDEQHTKKKQGILEG